MRAEEFESLYKFSITVCTEKFLTTNGVAFEKS